MTILVAGSDRVDAGKTTFTVGLLAHHDAVGFKPRAGNDFWFDHDDAVRALSDGRLYGKDATRLADASAGNHAPEDVNPVHRLWRPAPGKGNGLLGQSRREFLVDRVGEGFVVNGTVSLPEPVRENLPLSDAVVVDSLKGLNDQTERRYLPHFRALAERIRAEDRAVVESYSDIALPIRDIEFDAVAVVEPRRVRVYDGTRYAKACEVADSSVHDGTMEKRVADVVSLLDPAETMTLEPLAKEERNDPEKTASAYGEAYEALL
ncbi:MULTISPECIES: ATPase [unclassified Haladaptatus]|uniref:ATPase n=1 Tax=unclassified Haladaptatus TaxID=2622732 RepID=UPI00209C6363|nr:MULTISPECIES: ATPase [unclassified Haladaptatus]MCO8244007.1 ATPase [Haladaptatus sp. AB643]MCO8255813.1 ATPase [Haladaptatus sp. AB618]